MRRRRAKRLGIGRSRGPGEGWTLAEFARLAGVKPRTIRHYLDVGVLSRPPFRATATRYDRNHLLAVLAVQRLQSEGNLKLEEIRSRLSALKPAELEALATEQLSPGPTATALGVQVAPPLPSPEAKSPINAPGAARWIHIELALGLELHVRNDASATVMALAERVREMCAEER